MRQQLPYDWHWIWPTGNGDLGNQGIHQINIARWALGKAERFKDNAKTNRMLTREYRRPFVVPEKV